MKMLKLLSAIIFLIAISTSALAGDHPKRPASATLLMEDLDFCGEEAIVVSFWDTDGNVDNGADRVEAALRNDQLVYVVLFVDGELLMYSVTTPDGAKLYFSLDALVTDYSSPCAVVAEMLKEES